MVPWRMKNIIGEKIWLVPFKTEAVHADRMKSGIMGHEAFCKICHEFVSNIIITNPAEYISCEANQMHLNIEIITSVCKGSHPKTIYLEDREIASIPWHPYETSNKSSDSEKW